MADSLFDKHDLATRLRQMATFSDGPQSRLMNEAADLLDNFVGICAAWKRDYEGEKARGDSWMADCKNAEAALTASAKEQIIAVCPECGIHFDAQWQEKEQRYRALKNAAPQEQRTAEADSGIAPPAVAAPIGCTVVESGTDPSDGWIATSQSGTVLHLSRADGWDVQQVLSAPSSEQPARAFPICADHKNADWNQPDIGDGQCVLCHLFYLEVQESLLEEWQQRAIRAEETIAEIKRPLEEQMARLNNTVTRLNGELEAARRVVPSATR